MIFNSSSVYRVIKNHLNLIASFEIESATFVIMLLENYEVGTVFLIVEARKSAVGGFEILEYQKLNVLPSGFPF